MVRGFKLLNEKGQEFSMMDIENYCLLTEPSGLGFSYESEYERLGNSFVRKVRNLEQGRIDAIVNCLYYDNYKKLVDYIENSENLKLVYSVPYNEGKKEYLRDIDINGLSKTEKNTKGVISESVMIDCLSLWYEEETTLYTIEPADNEMRWDFEWDSRFTDYSSRSLQYVNRGHVEAPIEVMIAGPVKNPSIELYIEGELYQTVTINVEIAEFEKLLYGTKENEFYIQKQNTDGSITNLFSLDYIDFYNDNVIRIPRNKSCEIRLKSELEILNAEITIYPRYKAV